jgi:hypothetical protein
MMGINCGKGGGMQREEKMGWLLGVGAGTVAALAAAGLYAVGSVSAGFVRMQAVSYAIAAAVIAASCFAMAKLLRPSDRYLALAAGIPLGQTVLLLVSIAAFGRDAIAQVGVDIAALAAGLIWLMRRPGASPILLLIAYEAFALFVKGYALYSASFQQNFYRGVIVAILVQIAALFALLDGLQRVKRRASQPGIESAK